MANTHPTPTRRPRAHMEGRLMYYAGPTALCWKWARTIKEPDYATRDWKDVNCPRCLALKPEGK